jgi:hypothetical protein
MKGKAKQATGIGGAFRNAPRIDMLHQALKDGDRTKLEEIINDRPMNAVASKKMKGKGVTWETLLEDSVWQVQDPSAAEPVVVKLFTELPLHEIGGNVIATKLIDTAGPFFVRCLDVGRFTDTDANYFIIMEYVPDELESKHFSSLLCLYC